jgi:hypothetical protein
MHAVIFGSCVLKMWLAYDARSTEAVADLSTRRRRLDLGIGSTNRMAKREMQEGIPGDGRTPRGVSSSWARTSAGMKPASALEVVRGRRLPLSAD